MKCTFEFTVPSENPGFVEYRRAFTVQGKINAEGPLPDDAKMRIELLDENGNVVRHIFSDKKYKEIYRYHPDLTAYAEEMDPGRFKMQEFGYPVLIVDDADDPEASFRNATIKLWFSDTEFKGIFISASDIEHGAIFDDGVNFTDENGNPYSVLPLGNYKIVLTITGSELNETAIKDMVIAKRKDQLICRFNPWSHKLKMVDWCKLHDFAIISDLLPGYLEPYLWKWFYHMGLLKMYRANDICLFNEACIRMFVYLIDETSTSYETELAFLQKQGEVDNPERFVAYHYDIGEAQINDTIATTPEFKQDEYMYICRTDIVNKQAQENVYHIEGDAVEQYILDTSNIEVQADCDVAIMGVMKPWQMDPNDFILQNNNTYQINNAPDKIRYTISSADKKEVITRSCNLERFEKGESIGKSVYEFYNILHIDKEYAGQQLKVDVVCIDQKGNETKAQASLNIKVI